MPSEASPFEHSWQLLDAGVDALRTDRTLIQLTILLSVATLAVLALGDSIDDVLPRNVSWAIASLFVFNVANCFVSLFIGTALTGAALSNSSNGVETARSALAMAWRRIGSVFGYALLSTLIATVALVGGLLGLGVWLAWATITFLVIPAMLVEQQSLGQALARSASLLKQSWKETLVGKVSVAVLLWLLRNGVGLVVWGIGIGIFRSDLTQVPFVALSGTILVAIAGILGDALICVYRAMVYRLATAREGMLAHANSPRLDERS